MISLEIESRPVKLFPGTALQMEHDLDTFKWINLNSAHTYDFSFPRDGNETVLFHAGDDDNEVNRFVGAYKCDIYKWGNLLFTGTFELTESLHVDTYTGTFSTVPTDLATALDQPINLLFDEVNATLYPQHDLDLDVLNALPDKFVRFGRIDIGYARMINDDDYTEYLPGIYFPDDPDGPLPPEFSRFNLQFFNLQILLQKSLSAIGYSMVNQATATGDDISRIYLPGRLYADQLAGSNNLRDICPTILLRDLIKTFVSVTASEVNVIPATRELVFSSYDRIIADPRVIDFSKVIYRTDTLRNSWKGITFKFDTAKQREDAFVRNNPNELGIAEPTAVASIADLSTTAPLGTKQFAILQNAWYHVVQDPDTLALSWAYFGEEIFDRTEGDPNGETVEVLCPGIPMHKSILGFVRVENVSPEFLVSQSPVRTYQVAIKMEADVNGLSHQADGIDYDNFPPELLEKVNAGLTNRICFFVGKEAEIIPPLESAFYADRWQMLSDNISNDGTAHATFALRWNGPDNIIDAGPWRNAVAYAKTAPRILRHYAWLNDAQIAQLHSSTRKLNNGKSITLIRKIRYLVNDSDKMLVEIEGYRL